MLFSLQFTQLSPKMPGNINLNKFNRRFNEDIFSLLFFLFHLVRSEFVSLIISDIFDQSASIWKSSLIGCSLFPALHFYSILVVGLNPFIVILLNKLLLFFYRSHSFVRIIVKLWFGLGYSFWLLYCTQITVPLSHFKSTQGLPVQIN